jgi:DNA repair protein RadC
MSMPEYEEYSESPRYSVAIRELPSEDRPRERLINYGAQALSTAELIAIILRTGTQKHSALGLAEQVISKFGGLRGVAKASIKELSRVKGIGPVKAVQIAACVELGRRLAARGSDIKPTITSPDDVADMLLPKLRDLTKEQFVALLLDTKHRVIREENVSIGSLNSTVVHPREVFQSAIAHSAAAIVVVHNHPSGDPTPSAEDKQITTRLVESGKILGVEVLDHIILGDNCWVSLKQKGWM